MYSTIKKISDKLNFLFTSNQTIFVNSEKNNYFAKNYANLANESYCKNVIAFRSINLVASGSASVPWVLYQNKNNKKVKIDSHPLLDLLSKPNSFFAGAEFFENVYSYRLIDGNSYILVVKNRYNQPIELYLIRPDMIKLKFDENNRPLGYQIGNEEDGKFYPISPIDGKCDILHFRNFNPLDDFHGMSPVIAASLAIDQHNQASLWNRNLLHNSARPSGALIIKNGSFVSKNVLDDFKDQFIESYTGASKSGKPFLFEGDFDWKELGLSPKDMDFLEAKNNAAREISLAFGVPPQLLGIPGDNTYSNMQEARLALWEETIIPLLDNLTDALNNWLTPLFGSNLYLSYNLDEISGLSSKREKFWERINNANFLTTEQKLSLLGIK